MGAAASQESASSPLKVSPNKTAHLFIELEELHGEQWEERGRWNHALEEDIVEADGHVTWSRPHLPTLSVPALVRLRQALGSENVRAPSIDHLPNTCLSPRVCLS